MKKKQNGPKVLILDIETSPLVSFTWGTFDQMVAINQIKEEWHLLSVAAKWLGDKKVFHMDQRNKKNIADDSAMLKQVWKLMDEADIILGQNSKSFDVKKLNARFIQHGMQPPSSYKQLDTLTIARKHFAFTSNKLEWLTAKLNTKYKKLSHKKFPGFELWKECLAGNKAAWNEMKKYNIHDVLATEELYTKLRAWDKTINFNLYRESTDIVCQCGSRDYVFNGHSYTSIGKFKRYRCKKCGDEIKTKTNLLSKEKKASIRPGIR